MTQTAILTDRSNDLPLSLEARSGIRQGDENRVQIASALLSLQGAMYMVAAVEAAVAGSALGNAAGFGPAVLSLTLALGFFWSGSRLVNHRVRKRVRALEWALLVWAGIDLGLAVVLTDTGLGLVPTLTRTVVPLLVIGLLRVKKVQS